MSPRPRVRGRVIPALIACFYAGIVVGWLLHRAFASPAVGSAVPSPHLESSDRGAQRSEPRAAATSGDTPPAARDVAVNEPHAQDTIAELRARQLRVPIDNADVATMRGGFAETRENGGRPHEAVDLLAPRNTPVHAVEDGTIAKLFISKAGGTTIYQFDLSRRFCYYYAHLERYAPDLAEGQRVTKGQVVGYVGTSGNAPANTPHLHFAIFRLNPNQHWWEGTPLDPYLVFAP